MSTGEFKRSRRVRFTLPRRQLVFGLIWGLGDYGLDVSIELGVFSIRFETVVTYIEPNEPPF